MFRLFDAHTHLQDDRIKTKLPQILESARSRSISRIMCCGTCPADWPQVESLAQQNPGVILTSFGIHPWFVSSAGQDDLKWLEQKLKGVTAGVGEIGLDFALREFNKSQQERFFIGQLRLALKYQLPVSIHCRQAWGRMMEILKSEGKSFQGVIHSYSGGPELVSTVTGLGFHLSFSGTLTYNRNKKSRRSLAETPLEKILIETDTPSLIPHGAPGKLNEPANLPLVLNTVCEITGLTAEKAAALTWQNATSLFGGPI